MLAAVRSALSRSAARNTARAIWLANATATATLLALASAYRRPALKLSPAPTVEPVADSVVSTGTRCRLLSSDFENTAPFRSEERRVGKECRSRWSPDD